MNILVRIPGGGTNRELSTDYAVGIEEVLDPKQIGFSLSLKCVPEYAASLEV